VQSQILASTYTTTDTTLQKITNGFGFTGLILDIIGAAFGISEALQLQKSIRRSRSLQDPQSIVHFRKEVGSLRVKVSLNDTETPAARIQMVELLQTEMATSLSTNIVHNFLGTRREPYKSLPISLLVSAKS